MEARTPIPMPRPELGEPDHIADPATGSAALDGADGHARGRRPRRRMIAGVLVVVMVLTVAFTIGLARIGLRSPRHRRCRLRPVRASDNGAGVGRRRRRCGGDRRGDRAASAGHDPRSPGHHDRLNGPGRDPSVGSTHTNRRMGTPSDVPTQRRARRFAASTRRASTSRRYRDDTNRSAMSGSSTR